MKVIFLDVDGVLNSFKNILANGRFPWPNHDETNCSKQIGPESELDQLAIGMIRKLAEETGASIVLHSMWRMHVDPVDFGKRHNLPIIGSTNRRQKGVSIQMWLGEHPEVTHFVTIDDDDVFTEQCGPTSNERWQKLKDTHVKTDMMEGFSIVDFANAFLALDDMNLDEFERDLDRMRELRGAAAGLFLGTDDRSDEQRAKDRAELEALDEKNKGKGRWAVALMLNKTK
jgi:hypothetical protein